jgi:uncharacterized protein GlcG (DUF336 family)
MKSAASRSMMDAARVSASEIGKPVSVAIVDAAGMLVALERFDDALAATALVAEGKAVASASMGIDSGVLAGIAESIQPIVDSLVQRYGGRFIAAQGGVVVLDGTAVVGAVGVSGATSDEDEAIARAAAGAWTD